MAVKSWEEFAKKIHRTLQNLHDAYIDEWAQQPTLHVEEPEIMRYEPPEGVQIVEGEFVDVR